MKTTNTNNAALIADLKARIEKLIAEIEPLIKRRAELERECVRLSSPFSVGDVIETTKRMRVGRKGSWDYQPVNRRFVVEGIHGYGTEAGCWNCRQVRKDGTAGSECTVYDWDKPELVTPKRTCLTCRHCVANCQEQANWIRCSTKPGQPIICVTYAAKCPKFEALT